MDSQDSQDSDEFSYTNTASILKSLKQKLVIYNSDSSDEENENNVVKSTQIAVNNLININDNIKEEINSGNVIEIKDDQNETPIDINTTIDTCLQKNKSIEVKRKADYVKHKRISRSSQKTKVVEKLVEVDLCDVSTEDETDDEISVKVFWKSNHIEKFNMKRHEKMEKLFKYFANKENILEERLLFLLNNKKISKSDTAKSLGISLASIIEGGILSENLSDAVDIELKVQMNNMKHPMHIIIKSNSKMQELMNRCAEQLKVNVKNLKFYFDGDLINSESTSRNLDLEGGECIDCVVINN